MTEITDVDAGAKQKNYPRATAEYVEAAVSRFGVDAVSEHIGVSPQAIRMWVRKNDCPYMAVVACRAMLDDASKEKIFLCVVPPSKSDAFDALVKALGISCTLI